MEEGKIRVGYWKIRGLIRGIITLLEFCELPYVFEAYEQGDAPEYSR